MANTEISILKFVKKNLKLQGTQSGTPLELREMMKIVEEHNIVPEIELKGIEDVPEMMNKLADGSATNKMGVLFTQRYIHYQTAR
jgi:D-arabinose 1-dehydrogenase-like Zn-dependent alcohol dehydrogenase